MSRYAEGTTVAVDQSRGEITGILTRYGVKKQGWMGDEEGDELYFEIEGARYRFRIAKPTVAEVQATWDEEHPYAASGQRANLDWRKKVDAEWRRRWRANVLLLKAKLEFADGETSTVTRELMAYRLLPSGQTLEEAIVGGALPQLTARGR